MTPRQSGRPFTHALARIQIAFVPPISTGLERLAGWQFSSSERAEYNTLGHRRRADWVASRLALKLAGRRAGGPRDLCRLEVGHDAVGRPLLKSLTGRYCSLAHSVGAGVAAVSAQPVGIDLEPEARFDVRFARRIASRGEMILMAAARVPARLQPTLLWTVKEAVLKATGMGLSVDPRRVRVAGQFGSEWVVRFDAPGETLSTWRVASIARRGFRIAVARPLAGRAG